MRLILFCPIFDPGMLNARMGRIRSNVLLPRDQSSRVSTIHGPTSRLQCTPSPQNCDTACHSFPSY